MRDFAKISPKFWISQKGKEIKKLGVETQVIALYLMTSPHSTMTGIYYLPLALIVHETGISLEAVLKVFEGLIELGFCHYDYEWEYVWVSEMAYEQAGGQLNKSDNRVKAINESYQELPELSFLGDFFECYQSMFHLENPRFNGDLEAPSEPLASKQRSKKQRIEKQISEKEKKETFVEQVRQPEQFSSNSESVEIIFEHWKSVMQHPNAKLDDKRRKLIKNALKLGYTSEQICNAITGCSYTPHNMGDNERGQRYDGLHVILRDADQIDRFIANFHSPPKIQNSADRLDQSNLLAGQRWLTAKMNENFDEKK